MDHFARKPSVIPTFGIRIKESLEELDSDPDIIAKFEVPETPPWTYPIAMVNLTLSYAKKDQTDPSKYLSLHNEMTDVFRNYDFYTDGSVSDDKAAAAAVIDNYSSIERLPDKSSIFSAELHALYLSLIGWRQQMMMKGILSFSLIQSLLFRPFRAKTGYILLSSTYWNASIG